MANRRNVVFVDLTEDGEREYEEELRQIVDLTQEDSDNMAPVLRQRGQHYYGPRRLRTQRNPPLNNTHQYKLAYDIDGTTYHVNDFFELKEPVGEYWKSEFIEVKQIWVIASGNEVVLRGLPYARLSSLYGRFEYRINEVCQIIEVDEDDNRPDEQQAMIQVRHDQISTIRSLHKTNTDIGSDRNCRYGNDLYWRTLNMEKEKKKKYKQEYAPLTCRWKMRSHYRDANFRRAAKAPDTMLLHLLESDIEDPAYRTSDEHRRREWLKRHSISTGRQQLPYTVFDAFCGAGGASSGALQAGLKPTVAIDSWRTACDSYQLNFPDTILLRQDVYDFIARTELHGLPCIDILHISPPCQFYSPAKVHEGQYDEMNEVALWACGELLQKIRPRIVTMEQTFGLCQERFTLHFNKLIQCFTQFGYSVHWKERVELNQYGLPQNRQRLIIMGAAPGEQLPPWPAPTHGNGRKPWVTEGMAIGHLPRNVTLHDVQNARRVTGQARIPNVPLSRTICCGGAQGMNHFEGWRAFTLRELATLQAFPLNHEFVGSLTDIRKQIGNAFPASIAKVFFASIRNFLERQDRIRSYAARPGGPDVSAPGNLPDNRRRTRSHSNITRYSRLNGGMDEDEALQTAIRESRRQPRNRPREVITISDSEDDDGLPASMNRLSVQPNSGNQRRPAPPPPLSTASSCTLGNGPSPSPSARRLKSRKHKSDETPESLRRKRIRDVIYVASEDDKDSGDEAYYEAKNADRARARAEAREETASLPPREDECQPFALRRRKWIGKLAVTRDRADGWEF